MKKTLCLLALLSWSGLVNSALLANPVIDGREWMQLTDVTNYSWNDFNSVCDEVSGACTGSLSRGQDLTGWVWADINDFYALANHYIGTNEMGPDVGNVFVLLNYGLDPRENFGGRWMEDFERNGGDATYSYLVGIVRGDDAGVVWDDAEILPGARSQDRAFSSVKLAAQTGVSYSFDRDLASTDLGGWFYRAVSVPLSSTPWLVVIALVGLFGSNRRK